MKYLYRIFFSLFGFFVLSSIFYCFVEEGLFLYTKNASKKSQEMFLDSTRYDAVFIGTSRTYQNIDVEIIDSIAHVKTYNLGMAGAGGYEILLSLKGYLSVHPTPKAVVLNLDRNIFDIKRGFHNPLFYLRSFENNEVYNAFKEKGYFAWMYKNVPFSRMLEYSDDARNNSIRGWLGERDSKINCYNGFLPNYEKTGKFDTIYNNVTAIGHGKENFSYLDSIVSLCNKIGSKLIFITSPVYNHHYYKRYSDYSYLISMVKNNYLNECGIKMYYFDSIPINYNIKYFADNIHLNRIGTQQFSVVLAEKIVDNLK